ncbi:tonsoku-like protein [Camarhynchus parvulus]|uniref:tonsoku-like protein n=1 Tax=Geospiza parvula TaxID=87175 RepID=UPI001237FD23|nr:tonsoku-like protein [Camarhynchus parvulus]
MAMEGFGGEDWDWDQVWDQKWDQGEDWDQDWDQDWDKEMGSGSGLRLGSGLGSGIGIRNSPSAEVVRLLLSRGAALDDAGGPGCEGVTPLHDALASGRFPVAQLLIQSGAKLTPRNAKGQTPLQTLQEWLENFGPELDSETWDSAQETLRMLLEKAPPEDPDEPQIPNSSPIRKRQRTPDTENDPKNQNLGKPSAEKPKIPAENPNFLPKKSNFCPKIPIFCPKIPIFCLKIPIFCPKIPNRL